MSSQHNQQEQNLPIVYLDHALLWITPVIPSTSNIEMSFFKPRIAIVGGGLAGLTAGVLLHKFGVQFTIFELRKKPTDDDLANCLECLIYVRILVSLLLTNVAYWANPSNSPVNALRIQRSQTNLATFSTAIRVRWAIVLRYLAMTFPNFWPLIYPFDWRRAKDSGKSKEEEHDPP